MENTKNDVYDIFIQAGQSNAVGSGIGFITEEYIPTEDILYMQPDLKIFIAEPTYWFDSVSGDKVTAHDFSLSFSKEYIKSGRLAEGRKILILRAAVGGTGWLDNRWGMNDDLYLKMMEMIKTALDLNPQNKLVAFLWHQGETDAILNVSYEVHYNNLKTLVDSVRTTYNCPDIPFIAGDFCYEWKTTCLSQTEPVIQAIKDVGIAIGHSAFVETAELHSNRQDTGIEDGIHFSREALHQLGIKYFNAFVKI